MPTVRINIDDDKFKIPCSGNPEAEQKNINENKGPGISADSANINECEKVPSAKNSSNHLEGTNIEALDEPK